MIIALEPVYAILGAWILFAAVPTLGMVLGGLIMIFAIILASRT